MSNDKCHSPAVNKKTSVHLRIAFMNIDGKQLTLVESWLAT